LTPFSTSDAAAIIEAQSKVPPDGQGPWRPDRGTFFDVLVARSVAPAASGIGKMVVN